MASEASKKILNSTFVIPQALLTLVANFSNFMAFFVIYLRPFFQNFSPFFAKLRPSLEEFQGLFWYFFRNFYGIFLALF
jgi:hypothetical protein